MPYRDRAVCRMEAAGIEPVAPGEERLHKTTISFTKPQQIKTFEGTPLLAGERQQTISEHQNDIFLHEKCVICVSALPDDLQTVIDAWDNLVRSKYSNPFL